MFFWRQVLLAAEGCYFVWIYSCSCHEMGRTRGKRVVNTQEPGAPPPKRKRGKAMESMSSISQADGPQQRVTGRRRSRRGGAAYRGSGTIEGQLPSQADPPDEALTHTMGQTVVQNDNKPVIRRQDIVSLAKEIVKYLGTVNNVAGSGQQESSSPPSERPNVTTTTTTDVPPSVTTSTTTVGPPQDTVAFNPPVLIPPVPPPAAGSSALDTRPMPDSLPGT